MNFTRADRRLRKLNIDRLAKLSSFFTKPPLRGGKSLDKGRMIGTFGEEKEYTLRQKVGCYVRTNYADGCES